MKKLFCMIIAVIMLISACALAEGKVLTIGNIVLGDGSETLVDFSGIELKLAAAENQDTAGVSVAVAADGEEVARAVLSVDNEGLYLSATDISDVYSLSMDYIEAFIYEMIGDVNIEEMLETYLNEILESFEAYMAIFEECLSYTGVYELDGVEYDVYTLSIDHEHCMEIYALYDAILAPFSSIWDDTGYTSFVDMFESEGVEMTMSADIYVSEEAMMMDMYAFLDDEALVNAFVTFETSYYENVDMNGVDIYMALYDPSYENTDEGYLGYAFLTIYTDPTTDEFSAVDLIIGDAEDNDDETIYMALKPFCKDDEDVAYFTISTMDDSMRFDIIWSTTDEDFTLLIEATDVEDDASIDIQYWMPNDGYGAIEMSFVDGEEVATFGADVTISDDDGAWLPTIGATVDIITIDDAQLEKLSGEGMMLVSKLISACASANDDFAALIAGLM